MRKKLRLKNKFIPVNIPKLFNQEKIYVKKCLTSGWISSEGMYVKKFEDDFSKYNKRLYGVAVSSGTGALEIALKSFNLNRGDEIIIPTFSIISTALCVVKLGLKPILVDSDLMIWNMDPEQVLKKISKKTKAIVITHIYGFPVNMKKILRLAKKKNIRIIEDAAEMIGQTYNKKRCGSFGDISTFSFYANKHVTTGEGGMILTNNKKLYDKCKSLRNLCFGKGNNRFNHDDIGWNYRMTNLQAAIGCGQLKNISKIIRRKREIGRRYISILKNNKKIYIQPNKLDYAENIFWVFGVLLKKNVSVSRDFIVKKLFKKNIQTRTFFFPMHKQNVFKKMKLFSKNEKFVNADYLSKNGFYLPSGLGITNSEIDFVAKNLIKILDNKN
jgi:perosamine synthetase